MDPSLTEDVIRLTSALLTVYIEPRDEIDRLVAKIQCQLPRHGEPKFFVNNGYTCVAVDGSLSRRENVHSPAGFAAFFGPRHPANISNHLPLEMSADITVAELHAIHLAMTQASVHSLRKLMVITDSMQSLKMFQQLPSFIANGFADVKKSYIDIFSLLLYFIKTKQTSFQMFEESEPAKQYINIT